MQEADALYIMAEISIGLAGFSGVVAALHGRDDWHPLDVWRVVNLLLVSFGTLVLALVPVALHSFGITGSPLWRISSGIAVAYAVVCVFVVVRYRPDQVSIQPLFLVVPGVIMAVHLLNALAMLIPGIFGAFFTALLMGLAVAGVEFANILLVRPQR